MPVKWKESITKLRDIIGVRLDPVARAAAKDDLEILIKCVSQIADEQKDLKEKREQHSIEYEKQRFHSLQYHASANKIEEEAITFAKQQCQEHLLEVKNKAMQIQDQITYCNQEIKRLSQENPVLTERVEDAWKLWKDVRDLMSKAMIDKASLKIQINNMREKIIEYRERSESLREEAKEIKEDIQTHWAERNGKLMVIEADIAKWDSMIATENGFINGFKNELDALHERYQVLAVRKAKAEAEFKAEKRRMDEFSERTQDLEYQLQIKADFLKKTKEEIEALKTYLMEKTEEYIKAIELKEQSILDKHLELEDSLITEKVLEPERQQVLYVLETKKHKLQGLKQTIKTLRKAISDENFQIKSAMWDQEEVKIASRSLKSKRNDVIYTRQQSEKKYQTDFEELGINLTKEQEKRKKKTKEYEDSCVELQTWGAEMKTYYLEAQEQLSDDVKMKNCYKERIKELEALIAENEIQIADAEEEMNEKATVFGKIEKDLEQQNAECLENTDRLLIDIEKLKDRMNEIKPKHKEVTEAYDLQKEEHDALKEDMIEQRLHQKSMVEDSLKYKHLLTKLDSPMQVMKEDLTTSKDTYSTLLDEQQEEIKATGEEVSELMNKVESIQNRNDDLRDKNEAKIQEKKDVQEDYEETERAIAAMREEEARLKARFLQLMQENNEINDEINREFSSDKQELVDVKEEASRRRRQMSLIGRGFDASIQCMNMAMRG